MLQSRPLSLAKLPETLVARAKLVEIRIPTVSDGTAFFAVNFSLLRAESKVSPATLSPASHFCATRTPFGGCGIRNADSSGHGRTMV